VVEVKWLFPGITAAEFFNFLNLKMTIYLPLTSQTAMTAWRF
jgi:hypothetical protein